MKFYQVPVLRIKQCPDTSRWYRQHVGRFVPHRAWTAADGYKSTEPGGYTNFVRTEDAEPITALVREDSLSKWPYSHVPSNLTRQANVHKPAGCGCKDICLALDDCLDKARIDVQLAKATPVGQSRTDSMAETLVSIAVGFAVSMVIQALVLPAMGHHITLQQNFLITCIFTVASVVRGYAIRRAFNHFQTKGSYKT